MVFPSTLLSTSHLFHTPCLLPLQPSKAKATKKRKQERRKRAIEWWSNATPRKRVRHSQRPYALKPAPIPVEPPPISRQNHALFHMYGGLSVIHNNIFCTSSQSALEAKSVELLSTKNLPLLLLGSPPPLLPCP
jgi:hypothetical protein